MYTPEASLSIAIPDDVLSLPLVPSRKGKEKYDQTQNARCVMGEFEKDADDIVINWEKRSMVVTKLRNKTWGRKVHTFSFLPFLFLPPNGFFIILIFPLQKSFNLHF